MGWFLLSDVTVDDMATEGAYECVTALLYAWYRGAGLLVCEVLRSSI